MKIKKIYQGTVPANKILDAYSASNTDTYSCNYVNSMDRYSTDEVKTNKVWIDNRPIYRKVIHITSLSANQGYNHTISNLNEIIKVYGSAYFSPGQVGQGWQPVQRVVTDAISQYGIGVGDIDSTKFFLQIGTQYSTFSKAYVIFEYTKTTD